MTINRVKPAGWAANEKLTSAQQNGVDTNATFALDKRTGETDTLGSIITMLNGSQINLATGAVIGLTNGSNISGVSGSNITTGGNLFCTSSAVVRFQCAAINWNTSSDVTFGHVDNTVNSATGVVTNINGQNCTGTTSVGGDININAGTGTNSSGNFRLRSGATTVLSGNSNVITLNKKTRVLSNFNVPDITLPLLANVAFIDLNVGNNFIIPPLSTASPSFLLINNDVFTSGGGIYTIQISQNGVGGFGPIWSSDFVFGNISAVADLGANHRTIWTFKAATTNLSNSNGPIQLFAISRNNFSS